MSITFLTRSPRLLPAAMRLDRAPALAWIALQTAALWPTWRWMAARMADGSDDPLGGLALAALAALLVAVRGQLRSAPRLPWLAAALVGTLAATALHGQVTPLLGSLLAIVAWAGGLLAFLPDERRGAMQVRDGVLHAAPRFPIAALPVLGLAVLALNVLIISGFARLMFEGVRVDGVGAVLLITLVAAGCVGASGTWLYRLQREEATA